MAKETILLVNRRTHVGISAEKNKKKEKFLARERQAKYGDKVLCLLYIYIPPGGPFGGFSVTFYQKTNLFLLVFGTKGMFYR